MSVVEDLEHFSLAVCLVFAHVRQHRLSPEMLGLGGASQCVSPVLLKVLVSEGLMSSSVDHACEVLFPIVVLNDLGDIMEWFVVGPHSTGDSEPEVRVSWRLLFATVDV